MPLHSPLNTVAQRHVPIVDEAGAAHLSTAHQDLIREIEALEQRFASSSFVADAVHSDNAIKRVSFGSHAVGQPLSCLTGETISAICQDSTLANMDCLTHQWSTTVTRIQWGRCSTISEFVFASLPLPHAAIGCIAHRSCHSVTVFRVVKEL